MKKTALLLFISGFYCMYLYSGSNIEDGLLTLGLICIVFGLYLFVEQIGKDLNLINNTKQNQFGNKKHVNSLGN